MKYGRIVTISGEPGIGKTRCVEELSAWAVEQDIPVFWGYCHESSRATPVLIVLKDINWADAQTLQLLEFVAVRISGMRIVIIGRDYSVG